jgi:hypothetical protein
MLPIDLQKLMGEKAAKAVQSAAAPCLSPGVSNTDRLRRLLAQRFALRMEGCNMIQFPPVVHDYLRQNVKWTVFFGSNRSMKTTIGATVWTWAMTGQHPYDLFPPTNGNALVVSLDADHLAMLWRKISQPGMFYRIRDEHTGLWRAVRPHPDDPTRLDDYDEAYREKWQPAEPLLSPRRIRKLAMEDVAKGVPRIVETDTGWRSLWRPGHSEPPQGDHYNFALLDEQLGNDEFFQQTNRGLVGLAHESEQYRPKGYWTATPENNNPQLLTLLDMAEQGLEEVVSCHLSVENNPYIPAKERRAWYNLMSERERLVRYHGIPEAKSNRVYCMYDPQGLHGCEVENIPSEICRYLYIDPGTSLGGTLFLAIDSAEKHSWVYGGFTIKQMNAQQWAAEVAERSGNVEYEAAIIDQNAGRAKQIGGTITTAGLWWDMLMQAGVHVRRHGGWRGSGFYPACNDVAARQAALQNWMLPRPDGQWMGLPKLKVLRGCWPQLDKQIAAAYMEYQPPTRRSERKERRANVVSDAVVCLEYAAADNPGYRAPEARSQITDPMILAFCRRVNKQENRAVALG